jgi:hypothetical protein
MSLDDNFVSFAVAGRFPRKNSALSGGKGEGRKMTMTNPAMTIGSKSREPF